MKYKMTKINPKMMTKLKMKMKSKNKKFLMLKAQRVKVQKKLNLNKLTSSVLKAASQLIKSTLEYFPS